MTPRDLAARIDHTVLRPEASESDIDRLCDECIEHGFASACVNPWWTQRVAERLRGKATRVCAVAGFPLGASLTVIKAQEADRAVKEGAMEIDVVVALAPLLAGRRHEVTADLATVVDAVKRANERAIVKVIVESALLDQAQIVLACRCVAEAQAEFIKTSTGFHPAGGAKVEHVALMRQHIAPLRVKASGGIRMLAQAKQMLEAGADRLGLSASVSILAELSSQ